MCARLLEHLGLAHDEAGLEAGRQEIAAKQGQGVGRVGLGGCYQVVFEASGVDEAADGVVGQVAQVPGRCRVGAPGAR